MNKNNLVYKYTLQGNDKSTRGSINLFTLYRDTFSRVVCNVFPPDLCILIGTELFTSLSVTLYAGKVIANTLHRGKEYIIRTYKNRGRNRENRLQEFASF